LIFIHLSTAEWKKGLFEAAVLTAIKLWTVSDSTCMCSAWFLQ
jgi:hypothetical protein